MSDDLRSLRVGVVDGTSTVNFLDHQRIAHRVFANAPAGLNAVQTGSIDAFVYDCPLLSWIVKKDFANLQVWATNRTMPSRCRRAADCARRSI